MAKGRVENARADDKSKKGRSNGEGNMVRNTGLRNSKGSGEQSNNETAMMEEGAPPSQEQ